MALARTSLRGFLTHAKYHLQVAQLKRSPVTFVIGNESADLDSIASAITYAYIATLSPQQHLKPAQIYVPVLNIPRADIALRPELLALLPRANIGREHLITLDDLGDLSTVQERLVPEATRWVLVDHNVLQGRLGEVYSGRVVGVIDHHVDEGRVPVGVEGEGEAGAKGKGEPRVISTCGSCASLVVEHFRRRWDEWFLTVSWSGAANGQGDNLIEDGAFASLWDAQVAFLGLAAVLGDTQGLKDGNKTTEVDKEAVEYLETKIRMCLKAGKQYDRKAFFDEVQKAKEDLGGLSLRDVLRKDYKAWTESGSTLGTCAVVRPFAWLKEKAEQEGKDLLDGCRSFAKEHQHTVICVLTAYTAEDGAFGRQLMLAAGSDRGRKIIESFRSEAGDDLQLKEMERGDEDGWLSFMWQQGNVAASRKQVAPLLRKAMSSV
ncbi:hypothetical protein CAC42_238 [Sphaceloma murrayae]|uniref:DHHA2 domain-containing protein n=1 Tax=Sphaceloma murrayae TaxID=2082308 RepID=A0A2K1QMY9_9PEZI|nr:hypothetical protein CAC42_238 [Sphaceloma murrayae]